MFQAKTEVPRGVRNSKVRKQGEIGLNIRTLASPKVGQDQVSGGVSVLCWHAAPVANVLLLDALVLSHANRTRFKIVLDIWVLLHVEFAGALNELDDSLSLGTLFLHGLELTGIIHSNRRFWTHYYYLVWDWHVFFLGRRYPLLLDTLGLPF